jgi:hypothetical protein
MTSIAPEKNSKPAKKQTPPNKTILGKISDRFPIPDSFYASKLLTLVY